MSRWLYPCFVIAVACGDSGNARMSPDGGLIDPDCDPAGIPAQYACQENPLSGDSTAITAGETLYFNECVVCHGPMARGDGEEAEMFDPRPSDLIDSMANSTDDYLLWRIAEGGDGNPTTSDMPSWTEEGFSREQMWQVIAYLRSLE